MELLSPVEFFKFVSRVLTRFRHNQGILLSGAIAYYTLFSLIPLVALLLVVLSALVPEAELLAVVDAELRMIVPWQAELITAQLASFLSHREVIGWVGGVILLFASSLAFTALENAMSVIFFHRVEIHRRHFLLSAVIPYLYIVALGVGLLMLTLLAGVLQSVESMEFSLLQWTISLQWLAQSGLYWMGLVGVWLMFSSIYWVMPVGRISLRPVLIGGAVATLLWEGMRHLLVYYFSTISFADAVYGSLATAIIALFSLEMAGIILLLGAQVIAELEYVRQQDGGLATG
ncbi:MAG: YihY/virulence factor BrkB family protein [Gammaproteobacteria bacterium]|uniref:YihY/virulence factor BrkB family protein n=1 Tax=Candidatus Thiopontia autotrophica TaxID=2841688 RepID=A0A8J6NXW7_9GAMM|nr:YihY/virulence factor BrkB family protein [Candidatus Thiopontia autotrophica]